MSEPDPVTGVTELPLASSEISVSWCVVACECWRVVFKLEGILSEVGMFH